MDLNNEMRNRDESSQRQDEEVSADEPEQNRTAADSEQEAGTGQPEVEPGVSGQKAEEQDMARELNRLADAFARAVDSAWKSEQRRELQSDLNRGLRTLVERMESILGDFNQSEQGQEVRERANRVVEQVRSSKVAAELQKGMTRGLRSVAEELQEFTERMEKQRGAESSEVHDESDDAQDIPIENEDETTG